AVEGAGEDNPAAALEAAEHGAAVAARVEKGVQFAITVARNKDGLAAHVGREVVVLVGDLALVGEIDPVALEDVLHLECEYLRICKDPSSDPVGALFGIVFHYRSESFLNRILHPFPPRARRLLGVRLPLSCRFIALPLL